MQYSVDCLVSGGCASVAKWHYERVTAAKYWRVNRKNEIGSLRTSSSDESTFSKSQHFFRRFVHSICLFTYFCFASTCIFSMRSNIMRFITIKRLPSCACAYVHVHAFWTKVHISSIARNAHSFSLITPWQIVIRFLWLFWHIFLSIMIIAGAFWAMKGDGGQTRRSYTTIKSVNYAVCFLIRQIIKS